MRINSTQNISGPQKSKESKRSSSDKFSIDDAQDTPKNAPAGKSASLSNIDALLALQMVDDINPDARGRRKRAVSHGGQVLDALDTLKVALLSGSLTQNQLLSLKKLLEEKPDFSEDPELLDVLRQIDLRAQVELAKLGVF